MQIRMLREIDAMFEGAPPTRKTLEAKEELLQNLMEKYSDLLAEGRSEEAAFNIALGSIGDISDLLDALRQTPPKVAHFPEPDLSDYGDEPMASNPPMTDEAYARHNRAMIVTVAVMLYVLSPVAIIVFSGKMGILLLLAMIAAATGLLVYNAMTGRPAQPRDEVSGEEPEKKRKLTREQKRLLGSLSSALWLVTTALYFVISFATGAWHISWIIFLLAAAVNNLLKAFIDLYRE